MFTSGCIFDLMHNQGNMMFKTKNSIQNNSNFHSIETDVLNLMKRNKLEEKQQKRKSILLVASSVFAFVICGLLISI